MRRALFYTTIDEGILSLSSFLISLAFIAYSTREQFGRYTLVTGAILLLRGLQNSVVITPLTTHGAQLTGDARKSFVSSVNVIQFLLGLTTSLGLVVVLLAICDGDAGEIALSAAVAAFGTWLREFQRSVWLLEQRSGMALIGDAIYVVFTISGVGAIVAQTHDISPARALLVTGIAAFLPGVLGVGRMRVGRVTTELRAAANVMMNQGKWTLPNTLVIWGQNNGYSYIVSLIIDNSEVGTVATARLFVMPLLILQTAWTRILLPRAAALLAVHRIRDARALNRQGLRFLLCACAAYLLVIVIILRLVPATVLERYSTLTWLICLWGAFAIAAVLRNGASLLLLADKQFGALLRYATIAALVSLPLVVGLTWCFRGNGAVAAITSGELALGAMCWRAISFRRETLESSADGTAYPCD